MNRNHLRVMFVCLLFLTTAGLVSAAFRETPAESQGYTFFVNGGEFQPRTISLDGTPDKLRAGDLVSIDRMHLVLGEPGVYRFRTTDREDGRVLLVEQDGTERVVGAKLDRTYKDRKKIFINPLPRLSTAEVHGLWGIRINEWVPGLEERLAQINLERCCVTITDRTLQEGKKLPPLPEALHYLNVDESSNQGMENYDTLAKQSELRFFRLDSNTLDVLDARLIEDNSKLRYLDLTRQEVAHSAALGQLGSLRVLRLAGSDGLTDISFVRKLPDLRLLDVSRTGVRDLSPTGGLESLVELNADLAPVAKLPDGPLPSLKSLRIFSAKVPDKEAAAFADRHPQCRVWHGWDDALRKSLAGTTRIRVRSGGTCHRKIEEEKTHFEIKQPVKIRKFVDAISIDESRSGFHCMCCGNPSFEFYRGDDLVLTIGFHHGQSLRWPGSWPADGMMTPACASFVNEWLADHGVTGPRDEARRSNRQQDAIRRRVAQYERILPGVVLSALKKSNSKEKVVAAFKGNVKNPVERAALCLRLYGCDSASWNIAAGLDEFLAEGMLSEPSKEQVAKAVAAVLDDEAGINGAARWVFGDNKWEQVDRDALEALLPKLATHGLTHPREINRRRTMMALMSIKSDAAVGALRDVLAGKLKANQLPEGEQDEPGGKVSYSPRDSDLPDDCSDLARAGLALAKIGDRESLPAIRQLADKVKRKDRDVLNEAIEILTGKSVE